MERNTRVVGVEARVHAGALWQMGVDLSTQSLPISRSRGAQEAHSPRFVFCVQRRFDGYTTAHSPTTRSRLTFDETGTKGSASSISGYCDWLATSQATRHHQPAPFNTANRIFKNVLPLLAVCHFLPRLAFGRGRPLTQTQGTSSVPFRWRCAFAICVQCHRVAPFCY